MLKKIFLLLILIVIISLYLFTNSNKLPNYPESILDKNLTLKDTKEIALASRFLEYWHYKATANYDKSYDMELPLYRYLNTKDNYKSHNNFVLKNFKSTLLSIQKLNNDDDISLITLKYSHNNKVITKKEKWLYINGTWYHKYLVPVFPGDPEY